MSDIVTICGYSFRVTHAWLWSDGRITVAGECTDDPVNDSIRHTGYNGGHYLFQESK